MTISFVCRASKARKDGLSPIELSVVIDGKRSILALDRKCKPSQFNSKTQKVRGDKEINEYLDVVRKKCFTLETEIMRKENTITIERFVEVFKNGFEDKRMTLLKLFKEHNKEYENKVNAGLSIPKTLERYGNTLTRLEAYIKSLGKKDIYLEEITNSFIEGFQTYCLTDLKVSTTNKNLKHLKKILTLAVDEGYIKVNPFKIQLREEKLEYNVLNKEEIQTIINKKIENERIARVRDLFILQCYTGLSFCDMSTLTKDDVKDGVIIKRRKKTDVRSVIPLLPEAKRILEKYDYNLPTISNQKYNSYLTEIKDICNITKRLHSHLSRHTYATILINNGIELSLIAKILGHSSTRITEKIYAEVLDTTVQDNADKIAKAFAV